MKLKKIFKVAFTCGFLFFIGAGIYAGWEKAKSAAVFRVSSVEVKGVINADRDALTDLSKRLIGLNIFDKTIEDMTVSGDPWVRKLKANKVLPNSINLVVFEEKPLFYYKSGGKCYIFTGSDKRLAAPCENVKISVEGVLNDDKAKKFVSILNDNPVLANSDIVLKAYSFTAVIDGQLIICPYDGKLFAENYGIYANFLKQRYKRIDYVDLTIDERIFIKGDRDASSKG